MEPDQQIPEDATRDRIDIVKYYTQSGKTREQLETRDDVTTALQEMGVADALTANVAEQYRFNHPGERVLMDGMRFGFQTMRLEGSEAPITFNNLIVYATDEGSGKRVSWQRQFQDAAELGDILGLTKGTQNAQEIQTKVSSLVNRQPILVQSASSSST